MALPARVLQAHQVFLFGEGAAEERFRDELDALGARHVVLFSSGSLRGTEGLARIAEGALAGRTVTEVDEVIPSHAPISTTQRIAAQLTESPPPDVIVAVGGGSVSDTAKGVAILLAEGGQLEDHCSVFRPPDHFEPRALHAPKVPVLAVPTTLAGAEITPGGGATTGAGVKRTFWDPQIAARVVAFDPDLLRSVPADVLLTSGMNGLAHCCEGLYSRTANPISTALALDGVRTLASGLRAIAADDRGDEAIGDVSAGAALGGLVISNARVGMHHAVCHVLGAQLGLPHGVANSIMLAHVLRFNLPATEEPQARLARALGGTEAGEAADLVAALATDLGVPTRLRAVGVAEADLDGVAEGTMADRGLFFNPRTGVTQDEVLRVLRAAW